MPKFDLKARLKEAFSSPLAFWRLGLAIAVFGLLVPASFSLLRGEFYQYQSKFDSKVCNCSEQLTYRSKRLSELRAKKASAVLRLSQLHKALESPQELGFVSARFAIEKEYAALKGLDSSIERLEVKPVGHTFWLFAGIIVFVAVITQWIGKLTTDVDRNGPVRISRDWLAPFVIIVAAIFLAHLLEELTTSVFVSEKDRFHWTSFCISPLTFCVVKLYYLGIHVMAGFAMTSLYCAGHPNAVPEDRFLLTHGDGSCGMRSYIAACELCLGTSVLLMVPILAVVKSTVYPGFNKLHLATPVVELAIIALLIYRLTRNLYEVRSIYQGARENLGDWDAQSEAKIPPDPTLQILADRWWKLPGAVLAGLSLIWFLLEWLGVRGTLVETIKLQ